MSTIIKNNVSSKLNHLDFSEMFKNLLFANYLEDFANSSDFYRQSIDIFGQNFNQEKLFNLQQQWQKQDFNALPRIELRSSGELKGANGAFAAANNTIYLSEEYLQQNRERPEEIVEVILEEVGHFVDAQINSQDASGDEGAIFSALVRGVKLSPQEMASLKVEDDTDTITLAGQNIQVEQSTQPLREWVQTIVNNIIDKIKDSIQNNIVDSQASLPIIGSHKLSNIGQKIIDKLEEIKTTKLPLILNKLEDKGEDAVKQFLFNELGHNGLNLLRDNNGDHQVTVNDIAVELSTNNCNFRFKLGEELDSFATDISTDIGLTNLGLKVNNGYAKVDIVYELNLNFGQDNTGLYFNTSAPDDLKLLTNLSLPNLDATGELGFFDFAVNDKNTKASIDLVLDVQDADNFWRFQANETPTFDVKASGGADINLGLTTTVNSNKYLPSLSTDFNLNWVFNQDDLEESLQDFGEIKKLDFNDVQIKLGSFLDDFLGEFLGDIKQPIDSIIKIIKPVTDILNKPIDLKVVTPFTLLDLAENLRYIDSDDIKFLKAIDDIAGMIDSIPSDSQSGIKLGSFKLTGTDPRQMDFDLSKSTLEITKTEPGLIEQLNNDPNTQNFFQVIDGKGLRFPIFQKPANAFNLILGKKGIDLVTYDAPQLAINIPNLPIFEVTLVFLTLGMEGSLKAGLNFDFGFDSTGFSRQNNFQDGFYINDGNTPEVELNFGIHPYGEAGINLGLASVGAGVRGGLLGAIDLDIKDTNSDGKVRFDELPQLNNLNLVDWFDADGKIKAELSAYVRACINYFFGKRCWTLWSKQFLSETLIDFDLDKSQQPPVLATKIDGTQNLRLNIGANAGMRLTSGYNTDIAEFYTIDPSEPGNSQAVTVTGFYVKQEYRDVTKVIGDGGKEDDVIKLNRDLLISAELQGGEGADELYGGSGDDNLNGGKGADFLVGGAGADTLDGGNDDPNCSDGECIVDVVSYETAKVGVTLNLFNPQNNSGDAVGDIFNAIEQFNGSAWDDTLIGDGQNNIFLGGAGNDLIQGNPGDDLIILNTGDDDILYGEDGDDHLLGGKGNDTCFGGFGNDTVEGNVDRDQLFGDSGDPYLNLANKFANDSLNGGEGNDLLAGETGNDWLVGGDGDDELYGDDKALFYLGHKYLLSPSTNWERAQLIATKFQGYLVTINSIDENQFLSQNLSILLESDPNQYESLWIGLTDKDTEGKFQWINGEKVTYTNWYQGQPDHLQDTEDYAYLRLSDGQWGDLSKDGFATTDDPPLPLRGIIEIDAPITLDRNDTLYGGNGNDFLYGEEGDDFLLGEADDDNLYGGIGNDILDGGEGIDALWGEMGNDTLIGGLGHDLLNGNEGNDVLEGNEGNDNLYGGLGDDLLKGGLDADYLVGDEGKDTLDGGDGNDLLDGGFDNDSLIGGTGDDSLYGQELNDYLSGGAGMDYVDGGLGDDILYGDDGNDTLFGGNGRDILNGGNGNDLLAGNDAADTLTGGAGSDRFAYTNIRDTGDMIMDFQVGIDQVVLTELFRSLNISISSYSYAIGKGYLSFGVKTDDVILLLDQDGSGIQRPRPFITFDNMTVAALNQSSNFVVI
ncbi:MAG: hypothetical protein EWV55_16590 [Microcystis viridis Mv_BB_P_19951000_S69]|jgi:Ca2+-binding RTX toxin-like protein|uniref:C-type lectin domain-containing protein n=1 Tax=Microcystis viridis Mv_BB_P_19951000_S68D TaxID=2486270 RepID=A0A552HKE9_MICVR|nr:MAG: hypothetical protein EWV47_20575 [Microcystis viridis Mv_BB_P_19951000_S68]TRU71636.1 MAG: hypothetical protein EWV55_16590 [Microcystis viridis Mv_BB_P_19951000_S69]TRU71679.1 MAG: hypothetical protein EWV77_14875 [Microcystis viridis Mv_BB_P_19951000_S68D]TRU81368.1 MAG: hypothetical protein EWV46_21085 [Microcystis viridis Mv_BB_P_19951000_S69D]